MSARPIFDNTWRFGPVAGPIASFLAALIAAMVANIVGDFPIWLPVATAVGVMIVLVVGCWRGKITIPTAIFAGVCWIGYISWVLITAIIRWNWILFGIVVVATVVAAFIGPMFTDEDEPPVQQDQQDQGPPQIPEKDRPMEERLVPLIAKKTGMQKGELPTVAVHEMWANGSGGTYLVEGPPGSSFNWTWLRDVQLELAAALQLPAGCPVNAREADTHQGAALLDVTTVNRIGEDVDMPFPEDGVVKPRSIRNPFPNGFFQDMGHMMLCLYQDVVCVGGKRGSGKTVFLHNIIGNVAQCTDAVLFGVDMSGSVLAPWTMPYAKGLIPEPIFHRVAVSPATALEMAEYLTEFTEWRRARYTQMLDAHNVDVLPVGNGVTLCAVCDDIHPPEVVVILDEGGEVTGEDADPAAQKASKMLRKLMRIGRAMCVNVVLSTQRVTADYLPSQMKKHIDVMIVLRTKDDNELNYAFDYERGVTIRDLRYKGEGYVQLEPGGPVRRMRGFRILPELIRRVVMVCWKLRPRMEPELAEIGGDAYVNGWNHPDIVKWMNTLSRKTAGSTEYVRSSSTATAVADADDFDAGGVDPLAMLDDAIEQTSRRPVSNTAGGKDPVASTVEAKSAEQIAAEFNQMMQGWDSVDPGTINDQPAAPPVAGGPPAAPGRRDPVEDRLQFVVKLVHEEGPMKTEDIIRRTKEATGIKRDQTVKETLTEAKRRGLLRQSTEKYGYWASPGQAA